MTGPLYALVMGVLVVLSLAAPFLYLGAFSQRGSRHLSDQSRAFGRR